jgi:hypothetical protein
MKVLTAFAAIIVAGWALIKVIPLDVRGLVHLLVAGLPVLGVIAGSCLLLVLGSRITARTRRRSPQPSGPPAAPSRRATSAVPAPVLSPEQLIRPAAPASRPTQYRRQPRTEPGHAEASTASGPGRSGMLSASPAARPGSPAYEAAARGNSPGRRLPPSWVTPRPGILVGIDFGIDKESAAASTIRRVVLIDGCSGVQYGRGNEQYSAYRVTLPSVALESTKALARHLLSDDRKWSRDVFDHNGRASFAGLAGARSAFGAAAEEAVGDTLVIVRNSRGVQVGDGNTQHNEFQIRVADVAVRAVQVGPDAVSRAAVDRLCEHPSQATAEAVARQIADAAREHVVLDLTAQVTREIGSPVIPGRPDKISGRTGVQGGASARAHVRVVVKVTTVNVNRLTTDLLKEVGRAGPARPRATLPSAAAPLSPAPQTSRASPAPADQAAHVTRAGVTVEQRAHHGRQ